MAHLYTAVFSLESVDTFLGSYIETYHNPTFNQDIKTSYESYTGTLLCVAGPLFPAQCRLLEAGASILLQ